MNMLRIILLINYHIYKNSDFLKVNFYNLDRISLSILNAINSKYFRQISNKRSAIIINPYLENLES